jgi:hypothetical protein
MDPPLHCSVMYVELRNSHDVVSAIEGGFEALAGSGVIGTDKVLVICVEERVEVDHVPRHVMGPFEDLGSNVDQECIRGPAAKDHYFCWRVVHEEEGHGGAGSNGTVSNFMRVKAEGVESPENIAGVSKQCSDKGVANFEDLAIEGDRA